MPGLLVASIIALLAGPSIRSAKFLDGPSVLRYGKSELAIDLRANYDNPFDPAQVTLDAEIRTPSGRKLTVPGFVYQPFTRSFGKAELPIAYKSTAAVASGQVATTRQETDAELTSPLAQPSWRVRFTPSEVGTYSLVLVVRDRTGVARTKPLTLRCANSAKSPGFVRVSTADHRYFAYDDKSPYFPLGADVCWAGQAGTRDYEAWFAGLGKSGASWSRLWLSPTWVTFALERKGVPLGRFDLANAWRLDRAIDLATKNGIRLNLCIDSYNVLRDGENWPEWDRSPQNKANGGVISAPSQFWTSPDMARFYKAKLRYIVARYGWSPNVFSWEFWNEVDGVSNYAAEPVRAWHAEMAKYLRSIDPYRHLITTSFGGSGDGAQDKAMFSLAGLDFAQSHIYAAPDLAGAVALESQRLGQLGKPHFVAESGADTGGPRAEDDPTGMQIHDPMWTAIACGSSGGAMLWWWDSYIHPKSLYGLYGAARRFVEDVQWDREAFRSVQPVIKFQVAPNPLPTADIVLETGPRSFSAGPTSQPHAVSVSDSGSKGVASGILHGVGNHAALHNPLRFDTSFTKPCRLIIEVTGVSGYGGAMLDVRIDDAKVLHRDFVDPDGDRITDDLKQFVDDYAVEVPAGRHSVVVENKGQDWIIAGYRFKDAMTRTAPPLVAWATVGKAVALAWVRVDDRTWQRVRGKKLPNAIAPPSVLRLAGVGTGKWQCELWDTWAGRVVQTSALLVAKDGMASIALPEIRTDLAVKLIRPSALR